jgi:hypothetical protein
MRVPNQGKENARKLNRSFGGAAVALTVAGAVPSPLAPPFLLMGALMGALSWRANVLANDPPRYFWTEPIEPQRRALTLEGVRPASVRAVVNVLDEADALLAAGVVALERNQGAELAFDESAARERAREAGVHFMGAAQALGRVAENLSLLALRLPAISPLPLTGPYPTDRRVDVDNLETVRRMGLRPDDLDRLVALHATAATWRTDALSLELFLNSAATDAGDLAAVLYRWVQSFGDEAEPTS